MIAERNFMGWLYLQTQEGIEAYAALVIELIRQRSKGAA